MVARGARLVNLRSAGDGLCTRGALGLPNESMVTKVATRTKHRDRALELLSPFCLSGEGHTLSLELLEGLYLLAFVCASCHSPQELSGSSATVTLVHALIDLVTVEKASVSPVGSVHYV